MSERGVSFASQWIAENIVAGPYDPGDEVIGEAVKALIAAAEEADISREEIEEDMGDLSDLIADAHEAATDREVERLANEED